MYCMHSFLHSCMVQDFISRMANVTIQYRNKSVVNLFMLDFLTGKKLCSLFLSHSVEISNSACMNFQVMRYLFEKKLVGLLKE